MIKLNILAGLVIVMITSCLNMEKYERQEEEEIRKFLLNNPDLNFELKPSGLYYLDIVVGTGIHPVTHDTAYIMYTSRYLNGNTFDTNVGSTDTLIRPVNEGYLVAGFDEAITYMNVGGESLSIVPSYLGYGNSGVYVPSYTPILFEVKLVRVKQGPGAK